MPLSLFDGLSILHLQIVRCTKKVWIYILKCHHNKLNLDYFYLPHLSNVCTPGIFKQKNIF